MRIFKNAWFERFCRKQGISDTVLIDAVRRVEAGQVDADLGGGVLKQRIARRGQGKSGGYRTIILFRKQHRAFFVYGFAKSERDNIDSDEKGAFRKASAHILNLSEKHLTELIAKGQFVEITENEQEVPQ